MFTWLGDNFFSLLIAALALYAAFRGYKWIVRRSASHDGLAPSGFCNKCGWTGKLLGGNKACGRCGSIKLTMRTS